MNETPALRPVLWVASSKQDLKDMPKDVREDFGHWLLLAQKGETVPNAKIFTGFGGAHITELRRDDDQGTFRVVYTIRLKEVIAVLHAFKKKSKKGISTPKQEIELIRSRLKRAEEMYKIWKEKGEKNG